MTIGFIILGVLSLTIGVCMYFNIVNTKPLFVKWYAVVIMAIGTILVGYITLSQDKSSSKKTDDILEHSITTGVNLIDLNKKSDSLREENGWLRIQLVDLDTKLSEKNKTILELTQQTADLSIRLAEKAKSIYDLNKATKFPIPNSVVLSYSVHFALKEPFQKDADQILNKRSQFSNSSNHKSTTYFSVELELIKEILEWDSNFNEWLGVNFTKDYKISKDGASSTSAMAYSNWSFGKVTHDMNKMLLYNPVERKFVLTIKNARLSKEVLGSPYLNQNLTNASLFDLDNSTMIFTQIFPKRFKSIQITNFEVSSQELNLEFPLLNNTENDRTFICQVKRL